MVLPIKIYPDKILRVSGKEAVFPLSPVTKKLIRDMVDTVRAANGIGLAAPQVGISTRIIVVNLEHMEIPVFALINPEIIKTSKTKSKMEEGCLSIPEVFGIVERPDKITFKAQGTDGKSFTAEAEGLLAKVIQHEVDHINGILIIDKIKKYTQGKELVKN